MPNDPLSHEQVERLIEEELHEIEAANIKDGELSASVVRPKGWMGRLLAQIKGKI